MTQPDFSGIWQLNIEKSTLRGPAPASMRMEIEHSEPTLLQRALVIRKDGTESTLAFRYEIGAQTTNESPLGPARSHAQWDGTELVIESWLQSANREFHFKDHWLLSNDGNTLTMAHRDDDLAGQISVLEKASAVVTAKF